MAYIKLEDALKVCNEYKILHKKDNSRIGMAMANDIYLDIDNLPTADVVEVKHGKIIRNERNIAKMKEFHEKGIGLGISEKSIFWTCSECGSFIRPYDKYCSECGTKMRGDEE